MRSHRFPFVPCQQHRSRSPTRESTTSVRSSSRNFKQTKHRSVATVTNNCRTNNSSFKIVIFRRNASHRTQILIISVHIKSQVGFPRPRANNCGARELSTRSVVRISNEHLSLRHPTTYELFNDLCVNLK